MNTCVHCDWKKGGKIIATKGTYFYCEFYNRNIMSGKSCSDFIKEKRRGSETPNEFLIRQHTSGRFLISLAALIVSIISLIISIISIVRTTH